MYFVSRGSRKKVMPTEVRDEAEPHSLKMEGANQEMELFPDQMNAPEPMHRLDKATGGLLVFAKTKSAKSALAELFRERKIQKRYRAVVRGNLNERIAAL